MSDKVNEQSKGLDWLKWAVVAALVAAGIYANSYFAAESLLMRTIGLLVLAGVAGWVAPACPMGRRG